MCVCMRQELLSHPSFADQTILMFPIILLSNDNGLNDTSFPSGIKVCDVYSHSWLYQIMYARQTQVLFTIIDRVDILLVQNIISRKREEVTEEVIIKKEAA